MKIILLDEPFSGLSPLYIEKLKTIILKIKKEKILILTDHFYNDVLDIADTIYLCKDRSLKLIDNKEKLVEHGYLPLNVK